MTDCTPSFSHIISFKILKTLSVVTLCLFEKNKAQGPPADSAGKALATKPDTLSLLPRIHVVKERTDFGKRLSDFYTLWHLHVYEHITNK